MKFKILHCELFISFSFFAAAAVMMAGGRSEVYFRILYFAFFHELGHTLILMFYGYKIKCVTLTAFGARIECESFDDADCYVKALVWLSGAFVNLLFAAAFYISGGYTDEVCNNLLLALFNLMPYYNFDGWNALVCIAEKYAVKSETAEAFKHISSLVAVTLFTAADIVLIFKNTPDIMLILMNLYLIFGILIQLKPKSQKISATS